MDLLISEQTACHYDYKFSDTFLRYIQSNPSLFIKHFKQPAQDQSAVQ